MWIKLTTRGLKCLPIFQIHKNEKSSWQNNLEKTKGEGNEEQDLLETLSMDVYKDADLQHRLPQKLLKFNR